MESLACLLSEVAFLRNGQIYYPQISLLQLPWEERTERTLLLRGLDPSSVGSHPGSGGLRQEEAEVPAGDVGGVVPRGRRIKISHGQGTWGGFRERREDVGGSSSGI